MPTSLAWSNLVHQKTRTAIAVAGASFALILIFIQLGFLAAVKTGATLIYDGLDFDLLLISSEYGDINRPGTFAQERLAVARSLPEVETAAPLYIGFQLWRNPVAKEEDRQWGRRRRSIMILAYDLTEPVFRRLQAVEPADAPAALARADTVLIDRCSRAEFGPQEGPQRMTATELGRHRVEVVGRFTLGTGFGADGLLVTSDRTYARVLGRPLDRVCLGLVRLRGSASPADVQRRLNALLPADVRVCTREEICARERRHWVDNTSVGIIFYLGALVALAVGVVFVYQVVSGDVASHLSEYATLKAMGYSSGYLSWVVLQQAVGLALLAYLPSVGAALGLYALTRSAAGIPVSMTAGRLALVLALAILMCSVSGILALRKVRAADPADLF
jgi:putative ABC transport system permease protein